MATLWRRREVYGMRIELDSVTKRGIMLFYIISFVFSAVFVPAGVLICRSRGETMSHCIIIVLIFLLPVFISIILYVFVYADYEVDEFGITRYGCFGKLKLSSMTWDQMAFVGSAIIRTTFEHHEPEKLIFCAENSPYRKYQNSQYYVPPKGKRYCFHYSDTNQIILEEYSPKGFVELQ